MIILERLLLLGFFACVVYFLLTSKSLDQWMNNKFNPKSADQLTAEANRVAMEKKAAEATRVKQQNFLAREKQKLSRININIKK